VIKLLFLLFPLILSAEISLQQLQQSPSGHVRNFFIWQFMQEDNVSPTHADEAYCLVDGYNDKIFKAYAKKTENEAIKEQYRCLNLTVKEMLKENDAACVNRALSLSSAMELNEDERIHLATVLKEQYPKKSAQLELMNKKPFVLNLLKSEDGNYLEFFNTMGYKYRHLHFNVRLSHERINQLAEEKAFESAVKYIVTDAKMNRMQKALLGLSQHEFSAQTYFFLALNALRFKATQRAVHYLDLAQNKAYFRIDKDKAEFWKYLITKDVKRLEALTHSSDINIYTLYAKERLDVPVDNYFTQLDLLEAPSKYNIEDPYVWEALLRKIRDADEHGLKQLKESFNTEDDEVVNAFISAKSLNYQIHNYIMPYSKAATNLSNDEKAILYALGRQESHFIPSAISRSFALGVMQMMPFLIEALAKNEKEKVALEEMFDPYKNISYATRHISYLQKYLYHPLFIAYAYNGGIGFTKRHLMKSTFLPGSFEPFMSMELIANTESREYGKKVLANYVIYKKILGEEVKITSLFETLTVPSRTDRFRMKALTLKH
jgi:soluble lytic murein transglycosylase